MLTALPSAVATFVPRPETPETGTAAAVIEVLQPKPPDVVHETAEAAVEQEVMESAVTAAGDPVAFPMTLFAARADSDGRAMLESVFDDPEIVFPVRVCDAASSATVSVAAGTV